MNLNINNIASLLQQNKKLVISFFAVFYSVGFFGIIIPFTVVFFIKLFPFAILLSFIAILLFNDSKIDVKLITILLITCIAGFLIEVAGIKSHQIFGNYVYGETLGLKLFDTPLMIGINWAMLVFATASVVEPIIIADLFRILLASILMVLYDFVMETIAPILGMWTWKDGIVPVRNYIAWFIIALFLHSMFKLFRVRTNSTIALFLLICQTVFFILLIIFFRLQK